MNVSNPTQRPRGTRWCSVGSWIAGIGLVLAVAGVVGASAGALQPITAFSSFGIGMLLCLVALLPLVIGLLLSKGSGGSVAAARAWGALVAAGVLVAVSLTQYPAGDRAPPIHDVTTDLINPPEFVTLVAIREADGAQNPPEYLDDGSAEQQRAAFPDLRTLHLATTPEDSFAAAEQVARDLGWEIVAADPDAGRLEATATTTWFGFKDDVVIRLTGADGGTDVDVRSKSRVGRGDMGANAARIRGFLARLEAATG